MDIADAIDKVAALALAGKRVEIVPAVGEPVGFYYLVKPDGTATLTEAKPARHSEKLATPAQLRDFIKGTIVDTDGLLYYDDKQIVFVYEQGDKRDRATCELRKSQQYLWLENASRTPPSMDQKTFVKTLRILFRGSLGDSNLLTLARSLKFSATGDGVGIIQHGRESMGKNIASALTGDSALPEDVFLSVQVFENHPFKTRVACALEIAPQDQTFQLIPYPLEIQTAMDSTLENITEALKVECVPAAFRGSPL